MISRDFSVLSRRAIYRVCLMFGLLFAFELSVPPASAQGAFYVRDSFRAINNTFLEAHNPDVGIAGRWYRLLGQGLKVVQNALRPAANNTDESYGSNTSAGQSEYGIGMSVRFAAKQADPNCLTGFACSDHYALLWGRGDVALLNGYFARVTASGQVVILMNYKGGISLLASTVIRPPSSNFAHSMVFAIGKINLEFFSFKAQEALPESV